jgi:hypothetical protein
MRQPYAFGERIAKFVTTRLQGETAHALRKRAVSDR